MASSDIFKGISDIGLYTESEVVMINLIYFLDWNFINIGGYFNVEIPTTGAYGGDQHRLRPVHDPRYNTGQVWEGFRSGWVWQSGTSQPEQPIQVSGVFIDGSFSGIDDGLYVDYPNGKVVFSTPIPTTSVVTAEFTHKWVNIYDANDVPFFRKFQNRSFRADNSTFHTKSGDYAELSESRVQLPAVFVEAVETSYAPVQIGAGGGQWDMTEYIYHVFAEDISSVRKISDAIGKQNFKTIQLFHPDLVRESGTFPLDENGSIAEGAKTYPQMVELYEDGGYRWSDHKLYFRNSKKQAISQLHQNLYHRPVRNTCELILWDI